ncbi:hypothetical protein EXP36_01100 [Salmonella enterica subsp. enterica serovar Weltevreden]|nr:hypothetical protein [Salmonella enterica subsp. enterica serovar Braenderup]EBX7598144.1 hypothetical protein [Salmonella enterica subsp. enterica serovar Virchow]ECB4558274.1 hypothetical protein [Salmonella enterica subsp. enterica serovar Weltevreden]MJU45183.1 hypothetical protein [Salmonella enterica subsp. enterica serovar Stanley]
MATVVKKKRLHELDSYDGDKSSAVALISVDEKEYKLPLSEIGGGAEAKPIQNLSGADGIVEIDPNTGDDFIIRLGDPTTALSITQIADPVPGTRYELLVTLRQGTGANKITWPGSVKWPNGAEPPLSYTLDAEDVLSLSSTDGGVTWKGAIYGTGY